MGYQTAKGLPIPFGFDGNNVPNDLLAFAQRLNAFFDPHTYAEISSMGGSDLWEGRRVWQSDTGTLRPWTGLYQYKGSTGVWQPLVPTSAATYNPVVEDLPVTWGTGSVRTGRYTMFGTLCLAQFAVVVGTPGYVNTTWHLVAPKPFKDFGLGSPDDDGTVGAMLLFDASVPQYHVFPLNLASQGLDGVTLAGHQPAGTSQWQTTNPVTLANGDNLAGYAMYETAEL